MLNTSLQLNIYTQLHSSKTILANCKLVCRTKTSLQLILYTPGCIVHYKLA